MKIKLLKEILAKFEDDDEVMVVDDPCDAFTISEAELAQHNRMGRVALLSIAQADDDQDELPISEVTVRVWERNLGFRR